MASKATKSTGRAGHDAPITKPHQDRLGRLPIARNVHRLIVNAPEGWSTRIGLYGPWGEGKTSVLALLRPLLEEEDQRVRKSKGKGLVVQISAWKETNVAQVLEQIHDALDVRLSELVRESGDQTLVQIFRDVWLARVSRFFRKNKEAVGQTAGSVAGAVTHATFAAGGIVADTSLGGHGLPPPMASALTTEAAKVANSGARQKVEKTIESLTGPIDVRLRRFIDKLREHGIHRIVVFIDDLDRADPKAVPHTLLALRELLDFPDFAFVLAFDREVIGEALQSYSGSFGPRAQGFLEKIIDIPVELPPPTEQAIERFALEEMAHALSFIPEGTQQSVAKFFPANPRKVRSIVRSLAVLSDLGQRLHPLEVDWRGLILQLMFRHWAPPVVTHTVEKIWVGYRWPHQRPKVEGKSFDEQCKEAIQALLEDCKVSAGSIRDRERLLALGVAMCIQRQNTEASAIEGELAMLIAPPAFTYGEIERLKTAGKSTGNWEPLIAQAMRDGLRRCSKSSSDVAGELFMAASSWYGATLKWNDHADIDDHVAYAQAAADSALRWMEHLWNTSNRTDIQLARKDLLNAVRVLNILRDADALSELQIQLARLVISQGFDPVELHQACTKDFLNPSFAPSPLSDLVEPSLFDWLLGALKRRDGISDALAGEDKRRRHVSALFGAPWSPLFSPRNRARFLGTLREMRSGTSEDDRLIGARNAGQLLGRLSLEEGDGSWAHGNAEFFKNNHDFFREAWSTYMAVAWRENRIVGAERRWRQLVAAGVTAEALNVPAWLAPHLKTEPSEGSE